VLAGAVDSNGGFRLTAGNGNVLVVDFATIIYWFEPVFDRAAGTALFVQTTPAAARQAGKTQLALYR
jgi:hypothetical protein